MKYPIRFKLFIAMISLIVFFVFISWFANEQYLAKFYYLSKKNVLNNVFREINNIYTKEVVNFPLELEKMESARGLHITILDQKQLDIVYDSWLRDSNPNSKMLERFKNRRNSTIELIRTIRPQLDQGESIIKIIQDTRLNADFILFCSQLNNGDYIILRTSMAALKESVEIANRFFVFTGFFTILLGTVIVFLLSGRITKPILDLEKIAKKMAVLDFSEKYTVTNNDEIGDLGKSINSLSEQLEKSITELTKANQKLREDIERERQIDEMRKEFIANVSHELKTPIALIQGYAEGLKMNVVDDETSKAFYCDVIMDEAHNMNRLVKQLLELARLESGNNLPEKTEFNLLSLIDKSLKRNHILIEEHNIQLQLDVDNKLNVVADFELIEQVINNYLSNAINHLDQPKIIAITTQKVTPQKVKVIFFNTGKQIPETEIDKIWISFYKVDKARTRDYGGGTGLGLSIVRAILEAHGNSYGVNNVKDGVEFWFELDIAN